MLLLFALVMRQYIEFFDRYIAMLFGGVRFTVVIL